MLQEINTWALNVASLLANAIQLRKVGQSGGEIAELLRVVGAEIMNLSGCDHVAVANYISEVIRRTKTLLPVKTRVTKP